MGGYCCLCGNNQSLCQETQKNEPFSSVPCSRLVSIGNTPAVALRLDGLRKLGARLGVPNSRRLSKYNLCNGIVAAKGQNDVNAANGKIEIIDPKTSKPIRFISIRFLNVLFGEAIKPLLANRGQVLGRNQLEEKLKTDQKLWTTFIQEYNSDQEIYGENTFPSLEFNQDAKDFQKFPISQWNCAADKFKQLNKAYEIVHHGCHFNRTKNDLTQIHE